MKLLFIEDEPDAVKPVLRRIKRERSDIRCEMTGFQEAKNRIVSFRPDVVVLDLMVDGDPEKAEGLDTRKFIWERHFCPVVVFSAQPDIHDEINDEHPFITSVQKGRNGPRKILAILDKLQTQVNALKEAEETVRRSFSDAMKAVAPYAFETFSDDTRRNETITRSGRRRLAALMDEPPAAGTALASWEQYLFPPVGEHIQLGDVLQDREGGSDDPAAFRIVLTPSCDLVESGTRVPKVREVLVARCCSVKEGLKLTSLGPVVENIRKLKERLSGAMLTQGYLQAAIPFPCLPKQIPTMAANLRDLELIDMQHIGGKDSGRPFLRIASIDSPFRELVAWAYLQIACRPSLPDRDFDSWRDEVVEDVKNRGAAGKKHESV